MEKEKVNVTIGDVRYTLSGSDPEHMQQCADMVDACMSDITKSFSNLPETMVAVLAACNIADQYLTLRNKADNIADLEAENARLQKENTSLLRRLAKQNNQKSRENLE